MSTVVILYVSCISGSFSEVNKTRRKKQNNNHKNQLNQTTRPKFKQFEILRILESILYPTFTHDEVIFYQFLYIGESKQVYGS